jgi:hypothetical protein
MTKKVTLLDGLAVQWQQQSSSIVETKMVIGAFLRQSEGKKLLTLEVFGIAHAVTWTLGKPPKIAQ